MPNLNLKHPYVTCDWKPEQVTCPAHSMSKVLQFCLESSKGLSSCCGMLFLQTDHCLFKGALLCPSSPHTEGWV